MMIMVVILREQVADRKLMLKLLRFLLLMVDNSQIVGAVATGTLLLKLLMVLELHFSQLGCDTGLICPLVDGGLKDIDWVLDLLWFQLGEALHLGEAVLVTGVVLPALARPLLLRRQLTVVIKLFT